MLHQLSGVGVGLDRVGIVTRGLGPLATQFAPLWIANHQGIALAFALVAALSAPEGDPFLQGGAQRLQFQLQPGLPRRRFGGAPLRHGLP